MIAVLFPLLSQQPEHNEHRIVMDLCISGVNEFAEAIKRLEKKKVFTLLLSMGIKIWLRSVGSDSIFSASDADDLLPLNFGDFRWLVIQLNGNAVKLPG